MFVEVVIDAPLTSVYVRQPQDPSVGTVRTSCIWNIVQESEFAIPSLQTCDQEGQTQSRIYHRFCFAARVWIRASKRAALTHNVPNQRGPGLGHPFVKTAHRS